MSAAETFVPEPVIFTENAAAKVKALVEEDGNEKLMLRVYVTGGGCSGFQYGFTFDDDLADDDTVVEKMDAKMVVDSLSFQYLVGAIVDYTEGLEGSRFTVSNPNAATTCGCGMSFTV